MKRLSGTLLFITMISLLFPSCVKEEPVTESEIALGTLTEITFFKEDDRDAVDEAFSLIREEQATFDRHREGSELSALNRDAFSHPVRVSDELFSLIERSLEIADLTDGAFDPAIGPLVDLWKIGTDDARVPSDEEIEEVLPLLDWNNIMLDENEKTVSFLMDGMSIDLGAVAKGRISEDVHDLLREKGVERAIINLGGNVYTLGEKRKGTPWKIGIQDPSSERGTLLMTVDSSDGAVLTSGAYERFYQPEEGGPVYHHILDPSTGRPAESDLASTTLISSDASLADALSTAFFVLGSEKAMELAERLDIGTVLVLKDGSILRREVSRP